MVGRGSTQHFSCSVAGRRPNNEDSAATIRLGRDCVAAVVADGMGGARAGEVASGAAVKAFLREIRSWRPGNERATLRRAFREADQAIRSAAAPGREGMGSTMVAAIVRGRDVWVGNIGDSRAVLVAADEVLPLSREHSIVGEALRAGEIDEVEALNSPYRHAISRALGEGDGRPDIAFYSLREQRGCGDAFLVLGSDGVFNHVADADLLDIMDSASSASRLTHDIVLRAIQNGSDDNASAAAVVMPETMQHTRPALFAAAMVALVAFAGGVYASRVAPDLRTLLHIRSTGSAAPDREASGQKLLLPSGAKVRAGMNGSICTPAGNCFASWTILRADQKSAVVQIRGIQGEKTANRAGKPAESNTPPQP